MNNHFFIILFSILSINLTAQVPPEWDTAKTQNTARLNYSNNAILKKWDGIKYCTGYATNLQLANSNRGYKLLTPDPANYPYAIPSYQKVLYAKIDTMLMAFDTVGFKVVDVTLQYPLLVNSFPNHVSYLNFYKTIVQKIKKKGWKLSIGCQATFVDTVFGEPYMVKDIKKHYFNPDNNALTNDTLDNNRFKQEKLQMMQTILDSLNPDYMTIEMEPETQVINLFGLIDYSVDSTIANLKYYLANLNLSHSTAQLGSGAGTWYKLDFFIKSAQTNIDYIDFHIYPVLLDNLVNKAFLIDSIADANNKKLIISETWCYKETQAELTSGAQAVAMAAKIYSRDVFNYWQDLDTLFEKNIFNLANQSKIEMVNFIWPTVMFNQLTYDPAIYSNMSFSQILNAGNQAAYAKMFNFILSPVGSFIKSEIAKICSVTTGMNYKTNNNNFNIFPNPATTEINISFPSTTDFTTEIINTLGETVLQSQNKNKIDISKLQSGIYFIKATDNKTIYTYKIIIQ